MEHTKIIQLARETVKKEAEAVGSLVEYINQDFAKCVSLIYNSKGRVIITGIGKSANIAIKIVATLNSTGTPSVFMHAADAIHGDMGNIQKDDIVICMSKSGNTPEIKVLIPFIKNMGNPIIGMVGNMNSYLGKQSDYIINTVVHAEACPNNLAPTSSTTAQLVMGDALAICLLEMRGFSIDDFARYHPGGSLGKKMYLRVSDLYINNETPSVGLEDPVQEVILEITSKRLGATAVICKGEISGIITDGDIRRMLQKYNEINGLKAKDIMTINPKVIKHDMLAVNALQLMRNHNITQLLVQKNKEYVGVVHLHDLLNEGLI